jgi:hypothetical protein
LRFISSSSSFWRVLQFFDNQVPQQTTRKVSDEHNGTLPPDKPGAAVMPMIAAPAHI